MNFAFSFPYDLEDVTKDLPIITEDTEFLSNLKTQLTQDSENFIFDKKIFEQLANIIVE